MSIASDILRGHTEGIILARLHQKDSYGYEINKAIQKITNHTYELTEATLYTAFRWLEENGCITSYWGNETTGARRRYYSITDTGKETLKSLQTDWLQTKTLLDRLMEENPEKETPED